MRNMKNTTLIGNIGEQLACDYLTDKGYRILERNAKICGAEIDIICEAYFNADGSIVPVKTKNKLATFISKFKSNTKSENKDVNRVVIFCEVKARTDNLFGSGLEAVTPYKIGRYVTAAKAYMSTIKNVNNDLRFDVIEVGEGGINHIEGAFWENEAKYPRKR